MAAPAHYLVIDLQTRATVAGPLQTRRRASLRADTLDLAYGAIRYGVREVVDVRPSNADISARSTTRASAE